MENVVIVAGKRTPYGKLGGTLLPYSVVQLGAMALKETLGEYAKPEEIDQVIMGIVYPGGGVTPVRQMIMHCEWPIELDAMLVERACCSSMSAIGIAFERIRSSRANIILAGGSESMSNIPYMIPDLRWGKRIGDVTLYDELVIRNPYLKTPMAVYAGEVGVEWGEGREQQDAWAVQGHKRAAAAWEAGYFKDEVFPVQVDTKKGPITYYKDEQIRSDSSMEALAKMKPVYGSPTVTAGNASGLNDGAACVLLMSETEAKKRGIKPLGRIVDWTQASENPRHSPLLPSIAMNKLMKRNDMNIDQMGVIEINEAFAAMPLVSTRNLANNDEAKYKALRERTNVNGGGISIGHPVGSSGARIAMTMLYEAIRRQEKYAVCGICGAIGQGDAIIIEALQ